MVEVPEAKQLFDALSKSGNSHQMAVVPWFLNLFGCFEDVDMGFQGQGVQWNALFYRNLHQEMAELPYLVIFKNPHSILRGTRVIITYLSKPNPYLSRSLQSPIESSPLRILLRSHDSLKSK